MKIAVPVGRNSRCASFEECDEFALFEVDGVRIAGGTTAAPPVADRSNPGEWLRARGVRLVITSAIRPAMRDRLGQLGVRVVSDVPAGPPEDLAQDYLLGQVRSARPSRH